MDMIAPALKDLERICNRSNARCKDFVRKYVVRLELHLSGDLVEIFLRRAWIERTDSSATVAGVPYVGQLSSESQRVLWNALQEEMNFCGSEWAGWGWLVSETCPWKEPRY
jgi:hypothetical protein